MSTYWKKILILALGWLLLEAGGLFLILFLPSSRVGLFLLVAYMTAVIVGTVGLIIMLEKRGKK